MLLEFLFGQMLFIPIICSSNLTVQNPQSNTTNYPDTVPLDDISSNKTKITLVTEGGFITQINSNLTLPKDNNTILLELDKELGTPKNRSIVARKGVKESEFVQPARVNSTEIKDDQIVADNKFNNTLLRKNGTKSVDDSRIDTSIGVNSSHIPEKEVKIPHKPAVLSYEDLAGLSHNIQAVAKTSSKTFVSDQIPNPNAGMKTQSIDGNQPGMIMPVVITILTVPLFAVLGYMALRRGQEAWKNRHYKRMDFLLDGMYND